MKKPNLKLVVNNEVPVKTNCFHTHISACVSGKSSKVLFYNCENCGKKLKPHKVEVWQDSLGYVDYYAITD